MKTGRGGIGVVAILALVGTTSSIAWSLGTAGASAKSADGQKITIVTNTFPAAEGDPFAEGYAGQSVWVLPAIFDTLTDGSANEIQPGLATSWKELSPTKWEFQLRKGVKFSDGERFDASAAAYNLNYLAGKAGKQTVDGSNTPTLTGATAVGTYEIEVTTSVPTLDLPGLLDQDDIVAPDAWKLGATKFAQHPVGTGPYEVTRWTPDEIYLTSWSGAWQPAKYKELDIVLVPNQAAGFSALQSGEAQVLYNPSLAELDTAEHSSSLHVTKYVTPNAFGLQFLTSKGSPIMNQKVRVALNDAVDRPAIVKALGGITQAASQGIGVGVTGHDSSLDTISYDPSLAKKLLKEAGYGGGFSITAVLVATTTLGATQALTLLKSDLSAVGVKLSFKTLPFPTWLSDFLAADFTGAQLTSISYAASPQFDGYLPLSRGSCLELPKPLWCTEPQGNLLTAANHTTSPTARAIDLEKVAASERTTPPAIWLFYLVDAAIYSPQVKATMTDIGSINFVTLRPS